MKTGARHFGHDQTGGAHGAAVPYSTQRAAGSDQYCSLRAAVSTVRLPAHHNRTSAAVQLCPGHVEKPQVYQALARELAGVHFVAVWQNIMENQNDHENACRCTAWDDPSGRFCRGSNLIAPASAKSATTNDQGQWRSSKMIGVEVYNKANEKLGSIEDLVISTNGNIGSVIVGVGGFLGVGEHSVSVSFDKLSWVNEAVRTTTSSNTSSSATPATAANGASSTTTGMSTTTTTTTARTERAADEKWYPDHAVFDATKDQLKAMPTFKW